MSSQSDAPRKHTKKKPRSKSPALQSAKRTQTHIHTHTRKDTRRRESVDFFEKEARCEEQEKGKKALVETRVYLAATKGRRRR